MATVQPAQTVKEVAHITEHQSLQLTRNLLRMAIFYISDIRELFPKEYFRDINVQSLDMRVKKLMPMDLESRRLIDWMEKGVYDALKKKYLKTMLFTLCEGEDGPIIEEYSFSFNYSTTSEEVLSMHMTKNGHHEKTLMEGRAEEIDPEKMRRSACNMMKTLVTLMRTLDGVPIERTILVKLFYYDDVTPREYEPPYFRSSTFDTKKPSQQIPLRTKAGEVNSKFFALLLKVKSTLDSCVEDENERNSAYVPISTGACSEGSSGSAESEAGVYDCTEIDSQFGSTCGALQSFGSELTSYGAGSPTHKSKGRKASSLEPRISKHANLGESHLNANNVSVCIFSPLKQKALCERGLEFRDSQDTFDKVDLSITKASMVEQPIYQSEKRLRRR